MIQTSVKQYFKSLQLFHLSLMIGILIGTIVICLVAWNTTHPIVQLEQMSQPVLLSLGTGLALCFLFLSQKVFGVKTNQLNNSLKNLSEKSRAYRTYSIIRNALAEFPALVIMTFTYLLAEPILGLVNGMILVYFIRTFPSKAKMQKDLSLSWNEREILENPEALLMETRVNTESN